MTEIKKTWVFTLNNYTDDEVKLINDLECNYCIYGREVGEQGTPHLQGYITFKNACRMTSLAKLIKRAHWEAAVGRPEAAINYCKKDGNYHIIDNRNQGQRNDLQALASGIISGGLDKSVIDFPHMYIRYHLGMEKLSARVNTRPRNFKPYVTWLWGKSGCGKTSFVVDSEPNLYIVGEGYKWWDGYEGQEAVLFDDLREDQINFTWLLRLIDRYPCLVQVKGGTRNLCSKRMYITCPRPPKKEFAFLINEDLMQLTRRIDIVTEVTEVDIGNNGYINLREEKEGLDVLEYGD